MFAYLQPGVHDSGSSHASLSSDLGLMAFDLMAMGTRGAYSDSNSKPTKSLLELCAATHHINSLFVCLASSCTASSAIQLGSNKAQS